MKFIKLFALAWLMGFVSLVQPCEHTKQHTIECIKKQMLHKGLATHADLRELEYCIDSLGAFFTWQRALSKEEKWEHLLHSPHKLEVSYPQRCQDVLHKVQKQLEEREKQEEMALQGRPNTSGIHFHVDIYAGDDEKLAQELRLRYPQLIIMTRKNHQCLHSHTAKH
jgi:hypothetical protein